MKQKRISNRSTAAERSIDSVVSIYSTLACRLDALEFGEPVAYVYNPLTYARDPHDEYLRRYARRGVSTVLVGMNPGPFGMVQTGVPFGEVNLVRDWLGIRGHVGRPAREHPKRPVLGFDCPRSEVSGRRLWGWARDAYETPASFFSRFFVLNYCPLAFVEESGRNVTPEKLRREEREPLFELCDRALRDVLCELRPRRVVGIGTFAERRARESLAGLEVPVGRMLHPSPQSPAANGGWRERAEEDLRACGVSVP